MSRLVLAVLFPGLFVCVLSAEEAVRPKCGGYTLYKDAGGYLMYHEIPVTFDDAKRRCAAEGGVLASPINNGTTVAMLDILKTWNVQTVFTGFSSKPHNGGKFSSIEGIRLSNIEHTWAPGEPNNYQNNENCIVLSSRGTMSDVKCGSLNPYVCFLSGERVKQKHPCGFKSGDYALDKTTGSCYKCHVDDMLAFNDAAKVCEQEGGHLLIINGDNEAQAINNLFLKNHIIGASILGFQLNKNTGKWMTLQGETIEDAGYAKWAFGRNSSSAASEARAMAVGLLTYDGSLYYTLPIALWSFICEKDPEIVVCE